MKRPLPAAIWASNTAPALAPRRRSTWLTMRGAGAQIAVDAAGAHRRHAIGELGLADAAQLRRARPCGTSNGSRRTPWPRCCGRSACRPAGRGTCSRCRRAARDDGADRRSAAPGSSASSVTLATQAGSTAITLPSVGVLAHGFLIGCPHRAASLSIVETWAAITFQPTSGKRTQVWLCRPIRSASAHLVLQVHRGDVAPQRQDVEPMPLFLDARARRAGDAMGMDLGRSRSRSRSWRSGSCAGCPRRWRRARRRSCRSAPARSARTVRGPPRRLPGCSASGPSRPASPPWRCATATRVASLPRGPMMDRPTGRPSTVAPGRLTCGTPVSPPWAHRQVMRSRSGSSTDSGWPRSGAGNGVVGRHRIVPGGSRWRMRPRASWRIRLAQLRSLSGICEPITRLRGDAEGEARIALVDPVLEGRARPRRAAGCAAPAPRPTGPAAP